MELGLPSQRFSFSSLTPTHSVIKSTRPTNSVVRTFVRPINNAPPSGIAIFYQRNCGPRAVDFYSVDNNNIINGRSIIDWPTNLDLNMSSADVIQSVWEVKANTQTTTSAILGGNYSTSQLLEEPATAFNYSNSNTNNPMTGTPPDQSQILVMGNDEAYKLKGEPLQVGFEGHWINPCPTLHCFGNSRLSFNNSLVTGVPTLGGFGLDSVEPSEVSDVNPTTTAFTARSVATINNLAGHQTINTFFQIVPLRPSYGLSINTVFNISGSVVSVAPNALLNLNCKLNFYDPFGAILGTVWTSYPLTISSNGADFRPRGYGTTFSTASLQELFSTTVLPGWFQPILEVVNTQASTPTFTPPLTVDINCSYRQPTALMEGFSTACQIVRYDSLPTGAALSIKGSQQVEAVIDTRQASAFGPTPLQVDTRLFESVEAIAMRPSLFGVRMFFPTSESRMHKKMFDLTVDTIYKWEIGAMSEDQWRSLNDYVNDTMRSLINAGLTPEASARSWMKKLWKAGKKFVNKTQIGNAVKGALGIADNLLSNAINVGTNVATQTATNAIQNATNKYIPVSTLSGTSPTAASNYYAATEDYYEVHQKDCYLFPCLMKNKRNVFEDAVLFALIKTSKLPMFKTHSPFDAIHHQNGFVFFAKPDFSTPALPLSDSSVALMVVIQKSDNTFLVRQPHRSVENRSYDLAMAACNMSVDPTGLIFSGQVDGVDVLPLPVSVLDMKLKLAEKLGLRMVTNSIIPTTSRNLVSITTTLELKKLRAANPPFVYYNNDLKKIDASTPCAATRGCTFVYSENNVWKYIRGYELPFTTTNLSFLHTTTHLHPSILPSFSFSSPIDVLFRSCSLHVDNQDETRFYGNKKTVCSFETSFACVDVFGLILPHLRSKEELTFYFQLTNSNWVCFDFPKTALEVFDESLYQEDWMDFHGLKYSYPIISPEHIPCAATKIYIKNKKKKVIPEIQKKNTMTTPTAFSAQYYHPDSGVNEDIEINPVDRFNDIRSYFYYTCPTYMDGDQPYINKYCTSNNMLDYIANYLISKFHESLTIGVLNARVYEDLKISILGFLSPTSSNQHEKVRKLYDYIPSEYLVPGKKNEILKILSWSLLNGLATYSIDLNEMIVVLTDDNPYPHLFPDLVPVKVTFNYVEPITLQDAFDRTKTRVLQYRKEKLVEAENRRILNAQKKIEKKLQELEKAKKSQYVDPKMLITKGKLVPITSDIMEQFNTKTGPYAQKPPKSQQGSRGSGQKKINQPSKLGEGAQAKPQQDGTKAPVAH